MHGLCLVAGLLCLSGVAGQCRGAAAAVAAEVHAAVGQATARADGPAGPGVAGPLVDELPPVDTEGAATLGAIRMHAALPGALLTSLAAAAAALLRWCGADAAAPAASPDAGAAAAGPAPEARLGVNSVDASGSPVLHR